MHKKASGNFMLILFLITMIGFAWLVFFTDTFDLGLNSALISPSVVPSCNPKFEQKYNNCATELSETKGKLNNCVIDNKIIPITIFAMSAGLAIFAIIALIFNLSLLKKIKERQDKLLKDKEQFDIERRKMISNHQSKRQDEPSEQNASV